MDWVTFTDYDTIDGCLEIADQPGVFLSEEVSTVFPEDDVKVHLLVWGLNEDQHREIQRLRGNIYELQAWLAEAGLAHGVAHPLWKVDERFGASHWRRLVLLFRTFETLNGLRDPLPGEVVRELLTRLTPADIERFAGLENLAPAWPEAWRKTFTGGSDDRGGIFAGRSWTAAEGVAGWEDFLGAVRGGRCQPGGRPGGPLQMAHSLYSTAFDFVQQRVLVGPKKPAAALVEKMFSRFMEGKNPTRFTLGEKLGFLAQGIASGKIFELARPARSSLWKELSDTLARGGDLQVSLDRATAGLEEPEERAFVMSNLIANQLAFRFFKQFIAQITAGRLIESLQFIGSIGPVALLLSPYIYSFRAQGRGALRDICLESGLPLPAVLHNNKRAWFTDTLEDVNGVATTICKMAAAARAQGLDLTVVTSRGTVETRDLPIVNFTPIGEFELPEYELQKLSFPPILEIARYIQREGFSEIIISTPGPVGVSALLAAKLLGLRTSGIYHTDFPQYVRILTDDSWMETLTWNYMQWFYEQLDTVFVNSEEYRRCWEKRGIPADRLHILPRGLDTALFHPEKRGSNWWRARGLGEGETGLLYVGRISKEKRLDLLVPVVERLRAEGLAVRPLLVGHGPYAAELGKLLPDAIFTGYLRGDDLAAAYASADVFVFPSTTDTFGNVILEAQAAGLPVVVSDQGGPRELVADGVDGRVVRAGDVGAWAAAIGELCRDPDQRRRMGEAARRQVENRSWPRAARRFWDLTAD